MGEDERKVSGLHLKDIVTPEMVDNQFAFISGALDIMARLLPLRPKRSKWTRFKDWLISQIPYR